MRDSEISRRVFLKTLGATSAMAAAGLIPSRLFANERILVTFPEKTALLLLTARPPQLETPQKYFQDLVTPNEALFVRWHLANIPTSIDLDQWRLKIHGNVEREVSLSFDDLKKFEKVGYTAVDQCAGNGRSFFDPPVFGGQWKNGAMGNITLAGARLRDVLNRVGLKAGSTDVYFRGLDKPALPTTPSFMKSLPLDEALGDDIIIAYEMNGRDLPMLNGFPCRLVVPGWYATYWVKSLSDIEVAAQPTDSFWMTTAYRIPDTPCGCVEPGAIPKRTTPITRMSTRSLIVSPEEGSRHRAGRTVNLMGIAFSGGYGIKEVLVSVDGGKSWRPARLGKDLGRYSWIQWFYPWTPATPGRYTVMVRATNSVGDSQPFETLWNPSGYHLNRIEKCNLNVL